MTADTLTELRGADALEFAAASLELVSIDPKTWSKRYRDPRTGEAWVMEFVHPEAHGGGVPILRRVDE